MNEDMALGLMITILFILFWSVIIFNYWLNEAKSRLAEKMRKFFGIYKG